MLRFTKMKKLPLLIFIIVILFSCKKEQKSISLLYKKTEKPTHIQENGTTIKTRFKTPNNFTRVKNNPNTFSNYLQNFPLKPANTQVHLYNGSLKNRQDIHQGILDITVGKRDLQQCADATMRLRSEFLYQQKRYTDIHFNFTNGFNVAYSKWRQGNRLKVNGNKVSWFKTNEPSASYASFQKYMQWIFMYAGTLSLSKEMQPISINNMQIGDVFIQGGSPGHAIIIVDMAENSDKEKIFMLAQSYMPAQDIHILKNLDNTKISPWYKAANLEVLNSPEWQFNKTDLKRFR